MRFTTYKDPEIAVDVRADNGTVDILIAGHKVAFLSSESGRLCLYRLDDNVANVLRGMGVHISDDKRLGIY